MADGNVVVNKWNSNVYIADNRSLQAADMPAKVQSQQNSMAMKSVAANPYATMVSQTAPASIECSKTTTVVETPMQARLGSSAIVVPKGTATSANSEAASTSNASNTNRTATVADSDLAMAAVLYGLGS